MTGKNNKNCSHLTTEEAFGKFPSVLEKLRQLPHVDTLHALDSETGGHLCLLRDQALFLVEPQE